MSIIVAVAENGIIGAEGAMPWRCPSDLKHFKRITLGKPVIVGRKTWESLGAPLPGRRNLVVTRQKGFIADGAEVADSLESALRMAEEDEADEIFFIGGGEIYAQAIDIAERLYLTRILANPKGDARFPNIDLTRWREVKREVIPATERDTAEMVFFVFERNGVARPRAA